jgi:MoxR-like ATPase
MPADVIGTNVIMENATGQRVFQFMHGPIFSQIVLADEINRATPKTQSALLEAMQEKQVTAGGQIRPLEQPFFVMATQNPLEQEGTYPLPEAQLDRFFFKLLVRYSKREELMEILNRTTAQPAATIAPVLDAPRIIAHQALVRRVIIAPHVQDYAVRCALATHPRGPHAIEIVNKYVRVGVSPRAAQAMVLAAKVRTLLQGRYHAAAEDVQAAAPAALRHRIILNFQAEAEGIDADAIVTQVINQTPRTLS